LEDELAKLGYRRRVVAPEPRERPGEIAFDERGNAVYQWKRESLELDNTLGERLRLKALEHPGLAIVDDDPPPGTMIKRNPKGLRIGYNPYESGMLERKERRRKTDLRELSRWIEMKRKMEQKKQEE
jgi:hypothetical protein